MIKRRLALGVLVALSLSFQLSGAAFATKERLSTIHVAKTGSDANDGSENYDYRIPLSKSANKAKFNFDKKVFTMVFDTDYRSVKELIDDKHLIQ